MNNESMLKIAICDDEQPIRDYLKKLTEKCTDAQVHVFANGEELLSDPTVYDIILLQIIIRGKDCLSFIQVQWNYFLLAISILPY